jgi:hypothetical protein
VVNAPATSAAPSSGGQASQPTIVPTVNKPTSSVPTTESTIAAPDTKASNAAVSSSSTSVAPSAPSIQAVAPGDAAVTVGDKKQPVTVSRADNQVTVTAGALSATLGVVDSAGTVAALDANGNVSLKPGDTIRIKLAGFEPGSVVEAWLFSTPQLMGTAKVGSNGLVVGMFTVPKNVPKGAHRIAIVAQTKDGKSTTLTVGVRVGNWKKERSIALWIIVLPIVLAVFGALLLPATRRRKKSLEF